MRDHKKLSESKGGLLSGCMDFGWKSSRLPLCSECVCVYVGRLGVSCWGWGGNIRWTEQRPGSEETYSNSSSATTFLCDGTGLASHQSSLGFQFPSSKFRGLNLKSSKISVNTTSLEIPKPNSSMNEYSSSIHFY